MNITNEYGLPDTFVKACENDPYFKGDGVDYSASEIIAPIRQVILKHRHWKNLTEDVSERVWSLFGKSVHYILEKAGVKNALTEERITIDVLGKKLSGAFDFYYDETLYDYKVTSVWSSIYGSRIADWTSQMNIYAYLMRISGFTVNALKVVAIYRDWSAKKQMGDDRYPPRNVQEVVLELWSMEKQKEFIDRKITELMVAENDTDEDLKECTDEQMWAKTDTYAVMKDGRKSAVKVCVSNEQALGVIASITKEKDKHTIVMRPGERTRCESYCPVKNFCSQYKKYSETKLSMTPEEVEAGA